MSAQQVILFACSKCYSRHPFEELSEGQQLCKVKGDHFFSFIHFCLYVWLFHISLAKLTHFVVVCVEFASFATCIPIPKRWRKKKMFWQFKREINSLTTYSAILVFFCLVPHINSSLRSYIVNARDARIADFFLNWINATRNNFIFPN